MKVGPPVPIGTLNAQRRFVRTLGTTLEGAGFELVVGWQRARRALQRVREASIPTPTTADSGRRRRHAAARPLRQRFRTFAAVTDAGPARHGRLPRPAAPIRAYPAKQVVDVDLVSGGTGRLRCQHRLQLREEFEAVPLHRSNDYAAPARRKIVEVMKELVAEAVRRRTRASYSEQLRSAACTRETSASDPIRPIHFGGDDHCGPAPGRRPRAPGVVRVQPHARRVPPTRSRNSIACSKIVARSRVPVEWGRCPYFKGVDGDTLERYHDLGVDHVIAVLFAFDHDGLLTAADDLGKATGRTPPARCSRSDPTTPEIPLRPTFSGLRVGRTASQET